MDDARFDAWTRRRFGVAVGSTAASLLGPFSRGEAVAKNGKRRRKKRCRKLNQSCKPSGKKKRCCKRLRCDEIEDVAGLQCCRTFRVACADRNQCCRSLECDEIPGREGRRCCGRLGEKCREGDCCQDFVCNETIGECEVA